MKRNVMKLLSIALVAMIMIMAVATPVMALDYDPSKVTANNNVPGSENIRTLGGGLVGILQTTGIVLSVVILIVIGIKYMMGSPEDKSQYKSSMLPYVIGAALIFAASLVANIVYQFFTGLGTGS